MTKKPQSLYVPTLHSYHGSKTLSSKSSFGLSLQLLFLYILYTFIAAVSTFLRLITDKTWARHVCLIFLLREIQSGISAIYRCYRNTQHCKPKINVCGMNPRTKLLRRQEIWSVQTMLHTVFVLYLSGTLKNYEVDS